MKKILRLVTTSVLTLTLVACGGNSSSSQSTSTSASTSTGQSTSTSTSTTVAVTSISIASSSSLSQTLGSTSKVTVNATFNSGATQSSVDWYVNDVKQGQTGTTFEYTPTAVGSFSIVAKVGSVSSNALSLVVGAAEFEASEPVVVDADTIEITAAAGAAVVVANHDLKDTSRYSLSEGKYILELKKVLKQGEEVKITLSKDSKEVTKSFTYDIESFKVISVGADTDGTYEITKPFYTDLDNSEEKTYAITWESDEITGTQPVAFSATAPEGATAMAGATGNQTITDGQTFIKNFVVNKDTVAGTYTFTYKVGSKEATATVVVKDPEASLTLDSTPKTGTGTVASTLTTGSLTGHTTVAADYVVKNTVNPETDGSFSITKPYLSSGADDYIAFHFQADAKNIAIPTTMNTTTNTGKPNRVQISLVGPDNIAVVRTNSGTRAQVVNTLVTTFRDAVDDVGYTAKIDSTTPAGTYTFTIAVFTSESDTAVLTKDVVIVVKDPVASLTLTPTQSVDASGNKGQELEQDATDTSLYVVSKPNTGADAQSIVFNAVLSNYESGRTTSADIANSFVSASGTNKDFLTYKTSATGPQTIEGYDRNTKIGIELDAAAPATNVFSGTEDYNAAAGYAVGNIVYSDGLFYKLLVEHAASTTLPASDTTNWGKVESFDAAYTETAVGATVYHLGVAYSVSTKLAAAADVAAAKNAWVEFGPNASFANVVAYNPEQTTVYAADSLISYNGNVYTNAAAVGTGTAVGAFDSTKWTLANFQFTITGGGIAKGTVTITPDATTDTLANAAVSATLAADSYFFYNGVAYKTTAEIAGDGTKIGANAKALSSSIKVMTNGAVSIANRAASPAGYAYYSDDDANIDIFNVFAANITDLTSTGDYVYTIQIGELTKTVTIRVTEPAVSVDFKLATLTGVDATTTPTLASMQAKDEYTVTLGDGLKTATIDFLVENMAVPTSGQLAYTLEVTTPTLYNKYAESVIVTASATGGVADNDGHLQSATLVKKATDADGTVDANINLTDAGDYTYSLTIAGETKSFVIHVVENAALSVESVYNSKTHLFLEEAKGAYLVSDKITAAKSYDLSIAVSGNNLPSGKVYYIVTANSTAPLVGSTAKELTFTDGIAKIPATWNLTYTSAAVNDMNKDMSVYVWLYSAATTTGTNQVGDETKVSLFDIVLG